MKTQNLILTLLGVAAVAGFTYYLYDKRKREQLPAPPAFVNTSGQPPAQPSSDVAVVSDVISRGLDFGREIFGL